MKSLGETEEERRLCRDPGPAEGWCAPRTGMTDRCLLLTTGCAHESLCGPVGKAAGPDLGPAACVPGRVAVLATRRGP